MLILFNAETLHILAVDENMVAPTDELITTIRNIHGESITIGHILVDMTLNDYHKSINYIQMDNGIAKLITITEIPYSITKQIIAPAEVSAISVPPYTIAIIDGEEYLINDGILEYSNENPGVHEILLKLTGYKNTLINIEVVAA